MPQLWEATVDSHRRAVRDAILDVTATLVAEGGLRAVTMSQVAERAGIGRATLYRYFPDVDAILVAWHERRLRAHLEQLAALRDGGGAAAARLASVLAAFASIQYEHRGVDEAASLHGGQHVARAQEHLHELVRDLLAEAVRDGEVRDDVPAGELASYCLHALAAASALPSTAAVHRLVEVTLSGLRPAT